MNLSGHHTAEESKKCKILSVEQRGEIIGRRKAGATYATLAREFGVSLSTVRGITKRYEERGTVKRKEGSGAKPLLTDRDVRSLVRNARAAPWSSLTTHAQALASVTGVAVSRKTVARRLKDRGLQSRVAAKTPFLNRVNEGRRLLWAQDHDWPAEEWGKVVYSDESRFSQFSDGHMRVIRPEGTRFDPEYTIPTANQCTSVMVWGCFWRGGVGPLVVLDKTMDQDVYIDTLSTHFIDWKKDIQDIHETDLLLLEDNARPHKGERAAEWKRLHGIKTVDLPAQSPDLNPIENIWGIIKKRLQQRRVVFSNMRELVEALREEWHGICPSMCQRLSDSMLERAKKVLDTKGHSIGK